MQSGRVSGVMVLALVAAALCDAAGAGVAQAQSFALDADQPSVLWAEVQRPAFRADQQMSAWLGTLAVRYKLGSQVALLAGLPFANVHIDAQLANGVVIPGASTTAIGLPYVGLRLGIPWQTVAVDAVVGVRLERPPDTYRYGYGPSPDAIGVAAAQGDYERFETFDRSHPWAARATALLSRKLSTSVALHLRAGAVMLGGDIYNGNRFFGDLGVATSYVHGSTLVNSGLTLRSGNGSLWGARWNVALGFGHSFGRSTPMAFVRIPLGGSTLSGRVARFVIGVGLTWRLSDGPGAP
jgi:hypothetical protein